MKRRDGPADLVLNLDENSRLWTPDILVSEGYDFRDRPNSLPGFAAILASILGSGESAQRRRLA